MLLLLMAGIQATWAQKIVLHLTDKKTVEYNISQLDSISFLEGTIPEEYEWVDLGLPSGTLWATCNVGANSPEEYGDYLSWGETESKTTYDWSTYKYCNGTSTTMTKYCTSSDYGTVDNKTELEPSDDAATVNWGADWQMPSLDHFNELINSSYTTATWTTSNGVYGRKITSKSNGNSIFFPAAGYPEGTDFYEVGSYGCFWSRSLVHYNDYPTAFMLTIGEDWNGIEVDYRYCGANVRPIRVLHNNIVTVKNISLNHTRISMSVNSSRLLFATVLPFNISNKVLKWESSNNNVASVDQTGKITALTVGTCMVTCSATDGSDVKAECQVTVNYTTNYDYVDLGLPSGTLWATCNVGANSPEEYGDYFAWGETEPKNDYSWSTYKYCKGSSSTMTKYCTSSDYGTVDNKTELESSDDAATANWGADWKMPSKEQFDELINSSYTTATWTTLNGVYGRKITSKSNGNSIFFPASGVRLGTALYNCDIVGGFWSKTLASYGSFESYFLSLEMDSYWGTDCDYRFFGACIRPVRVKDSSMVRVESIKLNQTELFVMVGEPAQLLATILPSHATNKTLVWTSSNTEIATVDQTGKVVAIAVGTCVITCYAMDGSSVKTECKVTVYEDNSGTIDGKDYVDLGLPSGTLWATCNVGASSPEEYGDYFAWGETQPKNNYDLCTYKYCMGTMNTMTKYCTNSDYGTVDNKTELEAADDAASVNWGSNWQMPSLEQFDELINSNYTTTIKTTFNGISGMKITSKNNGNSIFLPAAGSYYGMNFIGAGNNGNGLYWSRTLDVSHSQHAYYLGCDTSHFDARIYTAIYYRFFVGHSVRPVRVKK